MQTYDRDVERRMVNFYGSLSEKDRRRYAAVEAAKLGHGGKAYLARLFGCDPDTIAAGECEVGQLPADDAEGRIRKKPPHQNLWVNSGSGRRPRLWYKLTSMAS